MQEALIPKRSTDDVPPRLPIKLDPASKGELLPDPASPRVVAAQQRAL